MTTWTETPLPSLPCTAHVAVLAPVETQMSWVTVTCWPCATIFAFSCWVTDDSRLLMLWNPVGDDEHAPRPRPSAAVIPTTAAIPLSLKVYLSLWLVS